MSPKFSESKLHSAKSQNTILITILFFFTIVFLQFSIKFYFSGWMVLITNSKLMICVGKRRGYLNYLLLPYGEFSLVNYHNFLDNPLFPQTKILIFIWSQRTEKQKFNRKENVMSERVKMPVRHFLRSDYLHIFFSIKFLLFVSLVHQISI